MVAGMEHKLLLMHTHKSIKCHLRSLTDWDLFWPLAIQTSEEELMGTVGERRCITNGDRSRNVKYEVDIYVYRQPDARGSVVGPAVAFT